MNCPQCQAATAVIEKRDGIRRRRQCTVCEFRFTTYEVLAADMHAPQDDRRKLEDIARQLGGILETLTAPPAEGGDTQPLGLDLELPNDPR